MSEIIDHAEAAKEFLTDVDGYVYWCPTTGGCLASHHLRELADELDRRNKDWDVFVSTQLDSPT